MINFCISRTHEQLTLFVGAQVYRTAVERVTAEQWQAGVEYELKKDVIVGTMAGYSSFDGTGYGELSMGFRW